MFDFRSKAVEGAYHQAGTRRRIRRRAVGVLHVGREGGAEEELEYH